MADLTCVVCGEPWDARGVRHGDMLRWEASLFLKGSGCPSCEGESPFEEETLIEKVAAGGEEPQMAFFRDRLLVNPDEGDPAELFNALEGNAPKWGEPEEVVLWECAGCEVRVVVDHDNDYVDGPIEVKTSAQPVMWDGGEKVHGFRGRLFRWHEFGPEYTGECEEREPTHTVGDEPYCGGCAETCADCDTSIFARSELEGDPYDPGASFLPEGRYRAGSAVCLSCYEENHQGGEE